MSDLSDEQLREWANGGRVQISLPEDVRTLAKTILAIRADLAAKDAQIAALTDKLRVADVTIDALHGAEIRLEERDREVTALREALQFVRPAIELQAKESRPGSISVLDAALGMSGGVK